MENRILMLRQLYSAEKVLLDKDYSEYKEANTLTALKGERISYQIVYVSDEQKEFKVKAESSGLNVTVRNVKSVPVRMPGFKNSMDDFYVGKTAGMYPDLLEPLKDDAVLANEYSHSLYITCEIPETAKAGKYKVWVVFESDGEEVRKEIEIKVLNAVLPKQDITYTQWFHADCIASVYGYEILSEEHWSMIEKFMKAAVRAGVNMMLTPVFTLALDTAVGHERPTLQLVDITYSEGKYSFGFDNLKRWIDLCHKCGIEKFEISHFFTQWGARKTPKIVVNGEKMFGWHVDADDERYLNFLDAFLPALTDWLKKEGVYDNSYFHISDEPEFERDFEHYKKCYDFIIKYISAEKVMDAMSEYTFVERGCSKNPVVITKKAERFFEHGMSNFWVYYCCGPGDRYYSNRLIAMPSGRTRIMGLQLYKYDIKGFLHWGYNFYYTRFSKRIVNPFEDTDAGEQFPAGDAFTVYPGPDGPLESLRYEAFYQGLQDNRACRLLESIIGREAVLEIIDEEVSITFTDYPGSDEGILALRDKINKKLEEISG